MNYEKIEVAPTPWEVGENKLMVYCNNDTGQRIVNSTVTYSHLKMKVLENTTRLIASTPKLFDIVIDVLEDHRAGNIELDNNDRAYYEMVIKEAIGMSFEEYRKL